MVDEVDTTSLMSIKGFGRGLAHMDQHLGASITLSFALVVFFAIVLYQPEKPPVPSSPADSALGVPQESPPPQADPIPPVTPGEPLPELTSRAASAPSFPLVREVEGFPENRIETIATQRPEPEERVRTSLGGTRSRAKSVRNTPGADSGPIATRVAPTTRRHVPERPPHDAFTLANEGETLRDVAIRIYGSEVEAEALWRLNRDLIGRKDVPLSAGTLLRTPDRLRTGGIPMPLQSVADQSPLRK
jgi:hypothetical protein